MPHSSITKWALAVLVAGVLSSCGSMQVKVEAPPGHTTQNPESAFSHDTFGEILDACVDPATGYVDYTLLRNVWADELNAYLADVGAAEPERWSANEQKAFWINAHNAAAMKMVMDAGPVNSLLDIGGMFSGGPLEATFRAARRDVSFEELHGTFIRRFGDPRIYFALNWGARGCAPLANKPYTVEGLNIQLNVMKDRYINSESALRFDHDAVGGTVYVSGLIQMFQNSFSAGYSSLIEGLARYRPEIIAFSDYLVVFEPFDWTIARSDQPTIADAPAPTEEEP